MVLNQFLNIRQGKVDPASNKAVSNSALQAPVLTGSPAYFKQGEKLKMVEDDLFGISDLLLVEFVRYGIDFLFDLPQAFNGEELFLRRNSARGCLFQGLRPWRSILNCSVRTSFHIRQILVCLTKI